VIRTQPSRRTGTGSAEAADLADWERGVISRAKRVSWPELGGRELAEALIDLHDALDLYGCIRDRVIHPESAFPELDGSGEAFHEALRMAAEDARADAGYLIEVIGVHCGPEAAASVSGLPSGE
jgi:hypothetical protein